MEFKAFIVFFYLLNLLVLAGQWVGVLWLGKTEKNREWWCMAVGTGLTTIGRAGLLDIWLPISNPVHQQLIIGGSTHSGVILFAMGFAIHGCRSSNMRKRITELETMNLAQATELERLRNR